MICRSDEILKIIKEHTDTSDIGCGPTGKFNDQKFVRQVLHLENTSGRKFLMNNSRILFICFRMHASMPLIYIMPFHQYSTSNFETVLERV